ncbi:MAG: hypothetical protein ABEJ58_04865 [Halodesulfurarchaeum sp.]
MTDTSDSSEGATAEDETPRGAEEPETLEDRGETGDGEEQEDIPPEARDDSDQYRDKYDEAREVANPDQHRDEESYN